MCMGSKMESKDEDWNVYLQHHPEEKTNLNLIVEGWGVRFDSCNYLSSYAVFLNKCSSYVEHMTIF